ncbi:conserved hypothetical protein [Ricinus communis]|uniref:Reverse transcriptase zinc-binding domain-containing protein n=1 Tax=Ricinus communis TaxID=3988 RepID=B9T6W1_RICCO|nr:conserved hypothetical protein [Ricinus communis]
MVSLLRLKDVSNLIFHIWVKQFLWRIDLNSLPCLANLARRGISVDVMCSWCGHEFEDQLYSLNDYPISRSYWLASPLGIQSDQVPATDVRMWLDSVASLKDDQLLETFSVLLWNCWALKNQQVSWELELLFAIRVDFPLCMQFEGRYKAEEAEKVALLEALRHLQTLQ